LRGEYGEFAFQDSLHPLKPGSPSRLVEFPFDQGPFPSG
jgi:hypothetical protein